MKINEHVIWVFPLNKTVHISNYFKATHVHCLWLTSFFHCSVLNNYCVWRVYNTYREFTLLLYTDLML